VIHLPERISLSQLKDLDALAPILAAAPPVMFPSDPESDRGYHVTTRGQYLNEIFRRRDPKKRSIGQVLREEIAKPLNLSMYMGLGTESPLMARRIFTMEQSWFRHTLTETILPFLAAMAQHVTKDTVLWPVVSPLVLRLRTIFPLEEPAFKSMRQAVFADSTFGRAIFYYAEGKSGTPGPLQTWQALEYEDPSTNMLANAHSLAKLGQLILNGGELDGVRLLRNETLQLAMSDVTTKWDAVLQTWTHFSRGGWGRDASLILLKYPGWMGWQGWGGSMFYWNPQLHTSFGYAATRMGEEHGTAPDQRTVDLLEALVACIHKQNDGTIIPTDHNIKI